MPAISSTTPYIAVGSGVVLAHPRGGERNSDSQNSRCRFAHSTLPLICDAAVQHVVVVVPVDADVDEAEHVAQEHRQQRSQRGGVAAVRHLQPSTMMVMMMAITPSLKASSPPAQRLKKP